MSYSGGAPETTAAIRPGELQRCHTVDSRIRVFSTERHPLDERITCADTELARYRDAIASTSSTPRQITGTSHLEALVEDAATVYMAPEAIVVDTAPGEYVDLFSLGAIAYFLFSGQAPASSSLELSEKLRETKGLRYLRSSTAPAPSWRS